MSSSLLPSHGETHTTECSYMFTRCTHKPENVHLSTYHKHIGAYVWAYIHKYTDVRDVIGTCKMHLGLVVV